MAEKTKTSPEQNKTGIDISNDVNKKLAESYDLADFEFSEKIKTKIEKSPGKLKTLLKVRISNYLKQPFSKKDKLYGYQSAKEILSQKIFDGQTIYEAIYSDIKTKLNGNFKQIKSIGTQSGYLKINLENGKTLLYNLSAKTKEGLIVNEKDTQEKLAKLKKDIEKKEFIKKIVFAGAMISLLYEPVVIAGAESADKIRLKKLRFTSYGKEIEVDVPKGKSIVIDKNQVPELKEIIKNLDKAGYEFDPELGEFVAKSRNIEFDRAVNKIKYEDFKKGIKKMTYEDYLKNVELAGEEKILNKKEFFDLKEEALKQVEQINELAIQQNEKFGKFFKSKGLTNIFEKGIGKGLHLIMFPVFFKELHRHSGNLDALLKSGVEWGAFMLGAKLGAKAPGPRWFKMVFSLLVGTLGVIGGAETIHHFEKEIAQKFPNKEDFWQRVFELEKNGFGVKMVDAAGHLVSFGFINDFADLINTDIGLYNGRIEIFGKNINPAAGENITLLSNDINFGVNEIDYLNERISGVKHWNKEVEEFKIKAINQLETEIFNKDFKYFDVFKGEGEIEFNDLYKDDFTDKLTNLLERIYNPKSKEGSVGIKYRKKAEKMAEDIYLFTKLYLPKNSLLGELKDINHPEKGKKIDDFYKGLRKLLKDKKIVKENEIDVFIIGLNNIFYSEMDEKLTEILGNSSMVETILKNNGAIHNRTKDLRYELERFIKKSYYRIRKNLKQNPKQGKKLLKDYEQIIANKIDSLKINKEYIKEFDENLVSDKYLIDLALEGKLGNKVQKTGSITWLPVIENGEEKMLKTTGNIEDLIFISSLSEKNRQFWKKAIVNKILHPEKGIIVGILTPDEIKNKFESFIGNEKGFKFYNRIIDYKRKKYFIENIKQHGDSTSTEIGNDFIEVWRNTDILNAIIYTVDETRKVLKHKKTN